MKSSHEEVEAKKKEVLLLENQVKELEQKLQLADAKSKEKVSFPHCVILHKHILFYTKDETHFFFLPLDYHAGCCSSYL